MKNKISHLKNKKHKLNNFLQSRIEHSTITAQIYSINQQITRTKQYLRNYIDSNLRLEEITIHSSINTDYRKEYAAEYTTKLTYEQKLILFNKDESLPEGLLISRNLFECLLNEALIPIKIKRSIIKNEIDNEFVMQDNKIVALKNKSSNTALQMSYLEQNKNGIFSVRFAQFYKDNEDQILNYLSLQQQHKDLLQNLISLEQKIQNHYMIERLKPVILVLITYLSYRLFFN
jgi:hypothetical protein